jgi:hypothetical protein
MARSNTARNILTAAAQHPLRQVARSESIVPVLRAATPLAPTRYRRPAIRPRAKPNAPTTASAISGSLLTAPPTYWLAWAPCR